MKRPNILYIHSHDTGRYIQPYGHSVPTPNMQKLAEEGVLFRQAFCAGPSCSPSRAALVTGQYPHNNGMLGLAHRGFSLNDYNHHIIHTLRRAGYYSALVGMQHVAVEAAVIGYDQVLQQEVRNTADTVSAAVEFVKGARRKPFFLSVGFFETHRLGWLPGGPFTKDGPAGDGRYCQPPAPLPDRPEIRQDMADFKASAKIFDDNVGAVLDTLEAAGLADNTLVICTTDHGMPFPAMKCCLSDHGIGVMLIMRGPGGFAGGKVCDGLVSQIDIFATLCELLGIEAPDWLQGKSIIPLITGQAEEINEEIFAEVTYHASYEPMRAVRTGRYKYIRRYDGRSKPVMPNCDPSPSRDLWLQYGMRDRTVAAEQLYDVIFDPNEVNNLAVDDSYTSVLQEMRGRLDRWMHATNDPLLKGAVPAPSGAKVNDPDGLSCTEPPQIVP